MEVLSPLPQLCAVGGAPPKVKGGANGNLGNALVVCGGIAAGSEKVALFCNGRSNLPPGTIVFFQASDRCYDFKMGAWQQAANPMMTARMNAAMINVPKKGLWISGGTKQNHETGGRGGNKTFLVTLVPEASART